MGNVVLVNFSEGCSLVWLWCGEDELLRTILESNVSDIVYSWVKNFKLRWLTYTIIMITLFQANLLIAYN